MKNAGVCDEAIDGVNSVELDEEEACRVAALRDARFRKAAIVPSRLALPANRALRRPARSNDDFRVGRVASPFTRL